MPKSRLLFAAAVFAGLLFLLWLRFHQPPNTVDDAYITFRYARHIAQGVGFVYNAGERVLGTTTPAYALLLAGVSRATGFYDYPRLALVVNALCDALTFCLITRWVARLLGLRGAGLGAALLFAMDGRTLDFSTGGMETSFNVMAIVLTLLLFFEGRRMWAALAAGLAVLIRPDGVTLAAVLFAAWGLTALRHRWCAPPRPSDPRASWPWKEAALFAALVAPWALFALFYFGNPIPQSILAKAELYRVPRLMAARAFLVQLRTVFPFSLPPLRDPEPLERQLLQAGLPAGLCLLGMAALQKRHAQTWVIGAYAALFMAFFSVGNPLWLGWYEVPLMPMYWTLILGAVVWLSGRLPARRALRGMWVAGAIGVMAVPHLSRLNLIPWETPQRGPFVLNPAFNKRREDDYELLARMLQPAARQDRLVAIPEIGAFGYVYAGRLFDTSGLISPPVLKYYPIPGDVPFEIYAVPRQMIFDLRPDLFITFDSFLVGDLRPDDAEFLQLYRPTLGLTSHAAFGLQRLTAYRRAGLPVEVALPPEAQPVGVRFGPDLVTLEGYSVRAWADLENHYLEVTLFWRGRDEPIQRDLLARVNLLSASGDQVFQVLDYPGEANPDTGAPLLPTSRWTPGMWLVDRYPLKRPVPDAGPYTVAVTVFASDADASLPALTADGAPLPADTLSLRVDEE